MAEIAALIVRALSLTTLLALSLSTAQAAEWTVTGRVVKIADGDTLTVLDDAKRQHKIRLAGIDAPERRQAFGQRFRDVGLVMVRDGMAWWYREYAHEQSAEDTAWAARRGLWLNASPVPPWEWRRKRS